MPNPYYPWFPKAYAADPLVQAMTDDQDLAYRRLLDASWELGPLPDDVAKLASFVRYRRGGDARFKRAWTYPLTECWLKNGDGHLINPRLESVRDEVLSRSEKARSAAAARWSRRKLLKTNETANADALPEHSQRMAQALPLKEKCKGKGKEKEEEAPRAQARSRLHALSAPAVWWNQRLKKIEYTDEWRADLKKAFYSELGKDSMNEVWKTATRWFLKNPRRRTKKSRMDRTLYVFFENTIQDNKDKEAARKEKQEERGQGGNRNPAPTICAECNKVVGTNHECGVALTRAFDRLPEKDRREMEEQHDANQERVRRRMASRNKSQGAAAPASNVPSKRE